MIDQQMWTIFINLVRLFVTLVMAGLVQDSLKELYKPIAELPLKYKFVEAARIIVFLYVMYATWQGK
jgi:hypothetical protein